MLEISSKNGSRTDPLIGPKVISRSCQTDDVANDINSLVTTEKLSDFSISDKDKDRGSANTHLVLQPKELCSNDELRKGSEHDSLSDTKDKSNGTIGPSTSSPGRFNKCYGFVLKNDHYFYAFILFFKLMNCLFQPFHILL